MAAMLYMLFDIWIPLQTLLLAASIALYIWAAYDTNPFEKWEEMYG